LNRETAKHWVERRGGGGDKSLVELEVPAGTRAIYMDAPTFRQDYANGGLHFPREFELLLDRDLPIEITGSRQDGAFTVYTARVLPVEREHTPYVPPRLTAAERRKTEREATLLLTNAVYDPQIAAPLYDLRRLGRISSDTANAIAAKLTELLADRRFGVRSGPIVAIVDTALHLKSDSPAVARAISAYLRKTPADQWSKPEELIEALKVLGHGDPSVLEERTLILENLKESRAAQAKVPSFQRRSDAWFSGLEERVGAIQ
jgi:hypothetical protein